MKVQTLGELRMQFTLACISTGGPATTVTQGTTETVLNDPVTAQYIHTLTVTGRLPGLYNCTVSNNKPSNTSVTGVFTLEGMFFLLSKTC